MVAAVTVGISFVIGSAMTAATADQPESNYVVKNAEPSDGDQMIRDTGVTINGFDHDGLYVKANPGQLAKLRRLGYKVEQLGVGILANPSVDPGYTDFNEMVAEVDRIVAAFPALASKQVVGTSHEGKNLVVLKISDNVATDEDEPEMLFTANQHAREHLTVEMALFLANMFTSEYATDPQIKKIVDTREIWIAPMVNPDGVMFDMSPGPLYKNWRKNRQPNPGTSSVGTDLNRNWAYKWDCCGGASDFKGEDTYHGATPTSAPETKKLTDFVLGRRVGGVQQIKVHLDIHTFSELVLWPFGYTVSTVVTGMTAEEYDTHKAIGTEMALSNGYWPTQASGLYIADGVISDWMWGDQKIVSFTYEMFPKQSQTPPGFYPPASVIPAQTLRNRDAVIRLAGYADCPYRAIGKEHLFCRATDDYIITDGTATVAQGSSTTIPIQAIKSAGADQTVTLSSSGAPAGVTVGFPPTIQTDGTFHSVSISASGSTTPGAYTIVLTGTGSLGTVRTARIALTVTGNAACAGTDTVDHSIPDGTGASVSATIAIAGCGGNAGSTMRLDLKVRHTWIGDLVITLSSPTAGQVFQVHDRQGASSDNIDRSYTFDMSGAVADGNWVLRAEDLVFTRSTGVIDSWTITLK
jgi:hypothetical protein